jgi:hypothetical protein
VYANIVIASSFLNKGVAKLFGGINGGTKLDNPIGYLLFAGVTRHLSIDPSPPDASLKAARYHHLAAFLLGKSRLSAIRVTSNNH